MRLGRGQERADRRPPRCSRGGRRPPGVVRSSSTICGAVEGDAPTNATDVPSATRLGCGTTVCGQVHLGELAGLRIEDPGVLDPAVRRMAHDPAVAQERVRRRAEDPLRPAELGRRGMHPLAFAVALALEVPPIAAIARPVQLARRAPRRLPDRLLAAAPGHVPGLPERPVGGKVRHEQLACRPTASRGDPTRGSRASRRRARCADRSRSRGPTRSPAAPPSRRSGSRRARSGRPRGRARRRAVRARRSTVRRRP